MAHSSHLHSTHHNADHPVGHQHAHGHDDDDATASLAELLDLDAKVLGPYLNEVTGWAQQYAPEAPRVVVDMGAGTGTGTLALTDRFPQAEVLAVDKSEPMLDRIQTMATEHGVAERVQVLQTDLNTGWPQTGPVDVVWASSSLHEVDSPDKVLANIYAALAPGGLLVVLEIDSLPRFLPDDVEKARPGLEARCHAALAEAGWNAHPNWRSHLEGAGFTVAAERSFTAESGADMAESGANAATGPSSSATESPSGPESPSGTGRYADGYLRRMRPALDGKLEPEDLDALDRLLATDSNESLLRRDDLKVRVNRTAWAARRA